MLSVLISAYKNPDLIVSHVRECMRSSYVPEEIIVVNDCDGMEKELKEKLILLKRNTKIIYATILPPKIPFNYTGARNLGFWLSSGSLISIEDQDHIPHVDYYRDAIIELSKNPTADRCKTHKRFVINLDDILTKPQEEWVQVAGRPAHQDCAIIRRSAYLKIKGYDERFAGEYGWSATDWRRRCIRAGITNVVAGYQYVVNSEKTRGLSYRNYRLARTGEHTQSPHGILNFQYEYEQLRN